MEGEAALTERQVHNKKVKKKSGKIVTAVGTNKVSRVNSEVAPGNSSETAQPTDLALMKPELSYDDRVQTVHDSDEMKKLKERNSGNVNNHKTVTGGKSQDQMNPLFDQEKSKSKNSQKLMKLKRKYSSGKVFD